ncbi:MAG: hypothetical protein AAGJ46_15460 [Planctomycetota bacterium]
MKKFFWMPLAIAMVGFTLGCGDTATTTETPAETPAAETEGDAETSETPEATTEEGSGTE